MELNDLILTDEALEAIDGGVWVHDIDGAPGLSLMVVGLSSKDAQKSIQDKQATVRIKNRGKQLTPEQLAKCMRETLAEVVIKDWNIKQDGQPIQFSRERAVQWISSRNGEKFAGFVLQAAQQVDADVTEFIKDTSKN